VPGLFVPVPSSTEETRFDFIGANDLIEFQGNGPYRLVDINGQVHDEINVAESVSFGWFQSHFTLDDDHCFDARACKTWEQPVYKYTEDGPVYTGFHRTVRYYRTGKADLDLSFDDPFPYLLAGEFGLAGLLSEVWAPAAVTSAGVGLLTAANELPQFEWVLQVSYVDKREYLTTPP
jgi:hypothetical protein